MSEEPTPKQQEPDARVEQFNHFAHVAGHVFGFLYIVVTLLFGPVKSVALWLARQRFIHRYKEFVSRLSPALGLTLSLLCLSLLELSKIIVLMAYSKGGLFLALLTTILAKLSFGYWAHMTWHAARAKVTAAYPRIRAIDAWVGQQIAIIKGFRDRIVAKIKGASWYPTVQRFNATVRQAAKNGIARFKAWWAHHQAGKNPPA
jgi:hypothetical protein